MRRRRFSRRRGCVGKVRHPTREAARTHLLDLVARGGAALNVYPCRHCGGYHVGHHTTR